MALGEFELIRRFFAAAACARGRDGVALGIGDDCALLAPPVGQQLAVSTDTLVEGVHFPHDPPPFELGQRSLAVAASDLAAMGAAPLGFTLALTLPDINEPWLQAFAEGLDAMAMACGLALVGGDTTRGPLSLTVTVFGTVPKGLALTRAGAKPGELLCVGGDLGDAAGALPLVLGQQFAPTAVSEPLLARYWAPRPQFTLGHALRGLADAALDISDGLLADCGHIAAASGVALRIEQRLVPRSDALLAFAGEAAALQAALGGGDDYRLAFTLPAQHLEALRQQVPEVRVIGSVLAGAGVQLIDPHGDQVTPSQLGYQHFQEQP